MEGFEIRRLFWPAQRGEGPQAGREPGVEHVFVLSQHGVCAQIVFAAHFRFVAANENVTFGVIPRRNAVSPPQLTGNTPVLNVTHPTEVHVLVLFWYELNFARFYGFHRNFRQRRSAHVPLIGQHWLDHHAATVAIRHGQIVRFDLFEQAGFFKRRHHGFTRCKALKATELLWNVVAARVAFFTVGVEHFSGLADVAVERQDIDHRQAVTFPDFIVVKVVRRGDLHTTGAFFHIGVFIAQNGNATTDQRQNDLFADQVFVTRIFRVHCHAGITKYGFRTGGGDHQIIFAFSSFRAVSQRITQVPHGSFGLAVFDFEVRNRSAQFWIPVHQTFATVNQVFFVQTDKYFAYGVGQAFVHGEALALPVHGVAETAHLAGDGAARLCFPVPDFVDECFTAIVVAGFAFLSSDLTLNHHLRCDTRMVSPRLPQGVFTLHALIADHGVHDGLLESMTHVQAAGDVRRRDHDGKAFFTGITMWLEIALLFPVLVKRLLDVLRVICLIHFASYFRRSMW